MLPAYVRAVAVESPRAQHRHQGSLGTQIHHRKQEDANVEVVIW